MSAGSRRRRRASNSGGQTNSWLWLPLLEEAVAVSLTADRWPGNREVTGQGNRVLTE